jgi:hypothetical protein
MPLLHLELSVVDSCLRQSLGLVRCVRFFLLEGMPLSRCLEVAFLSSVRSGGVLQVTEPTFGLLTRNMLFTLDT